MDIHARSISGINPIFETTFAPNGFQRKSTMNIARLTCRELKKAFWYTDELSLLKWYPYVVWKYAIRRGHLVSSCKKVSHIQRQKK